MSLMVIGITGPSASGKTLLASTIANELKSEHVEVIAEDSYYKNHHHLSLAERAKINYDHPDSMDHNLLLQHITKLANKQKINVPIYDFANHERSEQTKTIRFCSILVLEGILLFVEPRLRKLMDIKIFMDTPLDLCLSRRLQRDILCRNRTVTSVLKQYEATVRPMYIQFIEPCKRYADLIVPNGGNNRIAINLIKAHMKQLLGEMN